MKAIDADKLKPDCMTKDGRFAISQSQIANAKPIQPSTDAVSRQELMKAFAELPHEYKNAEQRARTGGIAACQVIVQQAQPVTPTRVKAHWIKSESREGYYKCSKCLCEHNDPETGKWHEIFDFKYPSCPICGAEMKEGES